jgi:hypothetical protein
LRDSCANSYLNTNANSYRHTNFYGDTCRYTNYCNSNAYRDTNFYGDTCGDTNCYYNSNAYRRNWRSL